MKPKHLTTLPLATPPTASGFTLVEMAMVVLIVGLLIGGILQGQAMTKNAHVTAAIADVQAYETAVMTFKDIYDNYPGDMPDAARRLSGCNENCNPAPGSSGNNMVGTGNWANTWDSQVAAAVNVPAANENDETTLFWSHLLLSGLISGVDNTGIYGGTVAWGKTHPVSRLGGGFLVGYGNGARPPGDPSPPPSASLSKGPNGLILLLALTPNTGGATEMTTSGRQPLLPSMAARIDLKMDDGFPHTGKVSAYGRTQSCFNIPTDIRYDGTVTTPDCGLIFRITP